MLEDKRYLRLFPPLYLIFIGFLLFLVNTQFPVLVHQNEVFVIIGWGLITIGACLDLFSIFLFLKSKTTLNPHGETQHLVTSGFYQLSRNPMYLGLVFLLAGWGIKSGFMLTPLAVFFDSTSNLSIY